jgi:hypothetical protein
MNIQEVRIGGVSLVYLKLRGQDEWN